MSLFRQSHQERYRDLLAHSHQQLWDLLARSYSTIEALHEEYLRLLSLVAVFALGLQYSCGIYTLRAERSPSGEQTQLLIIDLPAGQLCWVLPADKLYYFRDMPVYKGVWRGFPRVENQLHLLLNPQLPFQPYRTEKMDAMHLPPQ